MSSRSATSAVSGQTFFSRRAPAVLGALLALLLAGVAAYLAPAAPALVRFGALPHLPERTRTFLVAGVTPKYAGYHTPAPEDFTGLTDTIVLVQLRAHERKVKLLNIPRDTWTNLPGWGMDKINAANPRLGPEGLEAAVQELTGLHLDGYVLLSLRALRDLTDAAGGVTVNVEKDMRYTDRAANLFIDFSKGTHHLNGAQAEAYLRFRHDGMGDIGRVGRQQGFLRALGAQLMNFPGVFKLPGVVGALGADTRTDLSRADVAQVLGALLRRPALETTLLPGNFGGGGTWAPDRAAIADLALTAFAPEPTPGDPRDLRVEVVNVGAPDGSARRLKARLEAMGYRNVSVSNGGGARRDTVVLAADRRAGQRLLGDVGHGALEVNVPGERSADLTVRLGADTPGE